MTEPSDGYSSIEDRRSSEKEIAELEQWQNCKETTSEVLNYSGSVVGLHELIINWLSLFCATAESRVLIGCHQCCMQMIAGKCWTNHIRTQETRILHIMLSSIVGPRDTNTHPFRTCSVH